MTGRRWLGTVLLALGLSSVGLAAAYFGRGVLADTRPRLQWQASAPLPASSAEGVSEPAAGPTPSSGAASPSSTPTAMPYLSPTPTAEAIPTPSPEATPATEPSPAPTAAHPLMTLAIPFLDLEAPVVEMAYKQKETGEVYWDIPVAAGGHLQGSAFPGQQSNIVIAGHMRLRETPGLFNRLPSIVATLESWRKRFKEEHEDQEPTLPDLLQSGPLVEVVLTTSQGSRTYVVTGYREVDPWQVEVMAPTPTEVVTLITCVPDWWYTRRLIVTAEPYRGPVRLQGIVE